MNILHPIILLILQLSNACTTQIDDTSIIHFDGRMFSNVLDAIADYPNTAVLGWLYDYPAAYAYSIFLAGG